MRLPLFVDAREDALRTRLALKAGEARRSTRDLSTTPSTATFHCDESSLATSTSDDVDSFSETSPSMPLHDMPPHETASGEVQSRFRVAVSPGEAVRRSLHGSDGLSERA